MAFKLNPILDSLDQYKYEYFLQGDVCRLCWQKNSFREISSTVLINEIKVEVLAMIRECLDLDFDLDLCVGKYPNKICENCWEVVKKFYSFKIHCKQVDSKLKRIIEANCQTTPAITQVKIEIKSEIKSEVSDARGVPNLKKRTNKTKIVKSTDKPKKSINICHVCCKQFDNSKRFADHNSECQGIVNGMYKCFGCDKKFKTPRLRTSHEKNFCKALRQGYKCTICNQCLPLRKSYKAHMRYHAGKENGDVPAIPENIFKCRKCDSSFKTRDNLKEHMATHKSIDNNYVCETCGRVFLQHTYLKKHMSIHEGVKPHVCTYCGLRFVQQSSLTVHLRKHTGERPYQCDLCPQRCVSSSNLLAHRRRHLGIKKFQCTICDKKFGYKLTLTEHIESAHALTKSHQCALCDALYSRKKELKRHIARKHKPDKDVASQESEPTD